MGRAAQREVDRLGVTTSRQVGGVCDLRRRMFDYTRPALRARSRARARARCIFATVFGIRR